ncbi:MAG: zf-TFIIB domain-containing protein [Candidatus Omnitrophica bacterium]|nr:zf-TFIIB domain-containing protein [Candidatus Omnitrophota bacterium]
MLCPRCKAELKEVAYEGVVIDTCGACEGEWLDNGEIIAINKAREKAFSDAKKSQAKGAQKTGNPATHSQEALQCPHCKVPMGSLNYSYSTGIIIDRCPSCSGLWLDKDELEHIQIVIEDWDKKTPELQKKFQPILAKIKADYRQKNEAHIDELAAGSSPVMNSVIKAVLYQLF